MTNGLLRSPEVCFTFLEGGRVSISACVALLGEINSVAQKAVSPTYQPVMSTKPPPATKINPYFPPQMIVINKSATWREAVSQKCMENKRKTKCTPPECFYLIKSCLKWRSHCPTVSISRQTALKISISKRHLREQKMRPVLWRNEPQWALSQPCWFPWRECKKVLPLWREMFSSSVWNGLFPTLSSQKHNCLHQLLSSEQRK